MVYRIPRHSRSGWKRLSLAYFLCVSAPFLSRGESGPQDLTQFSLEDLMNIQVTSVSKKTQKMSKTGAAVFVLNQDDIRRSGARNIPDLLRMVPGVNVARIDASAWAISIRGFNDRYANKVLVLIDGRSVYTPTFSGVYWDQQDVPLADIERIEVIRGPGGTVWGANAVNGVINIITKSSRDTQGGLITASTGSEENLKGMLQYGGKIRNQGTYRVFGRYFNVDTSLRPDGREAADGWHGSHGGFRSDWDLSSSDTLTVQGDLYQSAGSQTLTAVFPSQMYVTRTFNDRLTVGAGNLLGRWNHTLTNGSETSLQVYYDRSHRFDQGTNVVNTANADFQYHFTIGSRHDVMAGLGYRFAGQGYHGAYDATLVPSHRADNLYSTFFQDEIQLNAALALAIGSKFEHNDYTGFEYEPSAQLMWTPNPRHTLWASAAQAIRQPSALDAQVEANYSTVPLNGGGFGVTQVLGNRNLKAEQMRDYEVGYRAQVSKKVSVDLATFLSYYRRLRTAEPGTPFFTLNPEPPHLVLPLVWDNLGHARNRGAEVVANWSVTHRWRISPGFSLLRMDVSRDPSSQDTSLQTYVVGTSPAHQAQVRSSVDLARNWSWDTSAYFVGALQGGAVPAYTRLDTRLGWRPVEFMEFSVSGQNLLTPRHIEFLNGYEVQVTQVERSVVGRAAWRF